MPREKLDGGETMQGLFSRIPFFKDVSDLDFEKFERRCLWRRFEEGETVVDYEDESSDVYFIIAGDVRVLIRTPAGKEIILAEMRPGEFFGELSAIDAVKRSANVTALTRSELCIMRRSASLRSIPPTSPCVIENCALPSRPRIVCSTLSPEASMFGIHLIRNQRRIIVVYRL